MTLGLAWSITLSALGIVGILLAGSKRKVGWLVGMAIQPLWIIFAIQTGQYGFIANAVIYFAVYLRNYLLWRREERKPKVLVPSRKPYGMQPAANRREPTVRVGTDSHPTPPPPARYFDGGRS